MNGRLVLAFVFLAGGAVVAFAGAQPQASLNPAQALEAGEGEARVKGVIEAVDREAGTFVLAGGGERITVEMASLPTAVTPEKSLLAEGELVREDGETVLQAREIQMGCPSKYGA